MRHTGISMPKLSDAEAAVVRSCRSDSGCEPPWDEFFKKFIGYINLRIIKALQAMRIPVTGKCFRKIC